MYKLPNEKITKEMQEYSEKRNKMHIDSVVKYGNILIDEFFGGDESLKRKLKRHDSLKTREPEYTPYIKINWSYKLKKEGKKSLNYTDDMHEATLHHILNSTHHPEYWAPKVSLNKVDRDKPTEEIINATIMPIEDILEMVADWMAVSQERCTNSAREWANSNIGKRWKFDKDQIDFIYKCIDFLENLL